MRSYFNKIQILSMSIDEAYKILDLDPEKQGDEKELKKAYRKMAKKFHPDKGGNIEMMQKVNHAYEMLKSKHSPSSQKSATVWTKSNELDKIMAFENGELSEEEVIDLFQHLIDTGMVWHLQGFYGRMAHDLIQQGLCHR